MTGICSWLPGPKPWRRSSWSFSRKNVSVPWCIRIRRHWAA